MTHEKIVKSIGRKSSSGNHFRLFGYERSGCRSDTFPKGRIAER